MSRARDLANLANENALSVDSSSFDVGVSSTSPDSDLNVGGAIKMDGPSGVITATSFSGDGSALIGVAATDTIAAASLTVSGITTLTGAVQAKSTTESTTKDTGAVIVEGGVGIEKNLNVGGMSVYTGIATFLGDVKVGASSTTLFADISHGRIGIGTDSPERNLQFGQIQNGSPATANPNTLSLGSNYSSVANANPKLYIWERKSDNSYMALGVSNNQLDYMVEAATYSHNFYVDSTKRLQITNSGAVVTGTFEATSYAGDGSALTGVGGDTDITSCLFI